MTEEEVKARAMATLLGFTIEVQHPHIYVRRKYDPGYYWPCKNWAEVIELLQSPDLSFAKRGI